MLIFLNINIPNCLDNRDQVSILIEIKYGVVTNLLKGGPCAQNQAQEKSLFQESINWELTCVWEEHEFVFMNRDNKNKLIYEKTCLKF